MTRQSTHDRTSENLSDRDPSNPRPDLGDWSFEGISGGNFFDDLDPSFHSDAQDSGDLDLGIHQGNFEIAHHAAQAFSKAAQGSLSHVKERRRSKVVEGVTAEDFDEGAERNAYLLLMHFAHKLLHKKTTPKAFREGLEFFFGSSDEPEDISFDLCSEVLTIRPDIIRMRIQYEWWLRATVFTGPFDFDTTGVPKIIGGEILYHAGPLGNALAREVWVQPGITTEELFTYVEQTHSSATKAKMMHATDVLSENFILSKNSGWYFTGRNPLLMNMNAAAYQPTNRVSGGSVHWTRLFAMQF